MTSSHVIVRAKFVRLSVCPCGFPALSESIPLGKVYEVYSVPVQVAMICGGCKTSLHIPMVAVAKPGRGLLPHGIFEFDEGESSDAG